MATACKWRGRNIAELNEAELRTALDECIRHIVKERESSTIAAELDGVAAEMGKLFKSFNTTLDRYLRTGRT